MAGCAIVLASSGLGFSRSLRVAHRIKCGEQSFPTVGEWLFVSFRGDYMEKGW